MCHRDAQTFKSPNLQELRVKARQEAWLTPEAAPPPTQGDSTDATVFAKLNASEEGTFETLTRGYFSFAGNLLTGSLPAFLDSSQVPGLSKGLINLQVCSCLEHVHAEAAEEHVHARAAGKHIHTSTVGCEDNASQQRLVNITRGPKL